jgi:hypothetical protein
MYVTGSSFARRPKLTMHTERKFKLRSGKTFSQLEFFGRMVAWLEHHYCGVGHMANIQRVLSKMFRIRETRGDAEGIKYVKKTRLGLLKALEGLSANALLTSRNGVKFPKDLRFLKKVQTDKIYPVIRLVLSTLSIFRTIRGDGVPSFATIQQGPGRTGIPTEVVESIRPFLRSLGLNPKFMGFRSSKLNFKKFRFTVKQGPKGHALWTSYLDILSIPSSLRESIGFVGGTRLQEDMLNYLILIPYIREYLEKHLGKTKMPFRRLSVIKDKEGKNREIAILDYYSQAALEPLHKYLFKLLARISQDCTFDHGSRLDTLTCTPGSRFHSIDLSSATDRFPIELQAAILTEMFGKEYAEHWENIMVGYPFEYRGEEISYIRGNPMGAYSSWATFALAHHFVVYLACKQAKVNWKRCPYMMLGDDIVIADDKVAEAYMGLLQRFDVPFSKEKSHQSPYLFEFAKRFVHCGTEISPFPLGGLFENRNNWLLAIGTILEESHRKRWNPRIDIFDCALGYLRSIGYNKDFILRHSRNIEIILMIRSSFAGKESMANALRRTAFLLYGKDFEDLVGFFSDHFVTSVVLIKAFQRIFREQVSRITDAKNTKPLGVIAEDLVIIITSLFEQVEDPFLLIRSCPILQVYGEVEELYLQLLNKPMDDNALISGDYRNFLLKVTIPTSDATFYMRRKDTLQLATSRLVDQIVVIMKEIRSNPGILHPMVY